MLDKDLIMELLKSPESDRLERTIELREEKLGPVICAFSNDYPNNNRPGYIIIGVNDDGTLAIANETEERKLIQKRASNINEFDLMPCYDSSLDDLNLMYFENDYLSNAISKEILEKNNRNIEQQLASLRFLDINSQCPSNSAVLLFGIEPMYFCPGAYIQYIKLSGTEINTEFEYEKRFSGALFQVLIALENFINTNIIKSKTSQLNGFREKNIINYPLWALRELIMNAVMHRDYQSNAPIYIYEFSDRIEIVNPGGLYGDVNAKNFPNVSDYRNPNISEALKILGYVNKFNFGIKNAINILAENGNPEPEFNLDLVTKFSVTIKINREW